MTQEVIVYRNPAEKAFWDMMSNGQFFPVIAGVVVFFAVFLVLNHLFTRGRSFGTKPWQTNVPLALAALAGFATIWKMWL